MAASRTVLCLVFATASALGLPVAAQSSSSNPAAAPEADSLGDPPRGFWLPGGRSYLGLDLGRARSTLSCGSATSLLCGDDAAPPVQLYAGTMLGKFWGVEMGYMNPGRIGALPGEPRAPGMNLSLVGSARMTPSLRLYGRVGATYNGAESPSLAASPFASGFEQGSGLSFGGGLSFDLTRRLSATLEWERNDFRFSNAGRDSVRSTSLGLQYRY